MTPLGGTAPKACSHAVDRWGTTPGYFISIEDYPPTGYVRILARVMQEVLAGTRNVDKLLKMLDDDWDAARKGHA